MKKQPPMSALEVRERLEELVYKDPNCGCWIWLGSMDNGGYARCGYSAFPALTRAHRLSYTLFVRPIPEGIWRS